MTDEERQKQMDFILEHQAKFAIEIEQSNHRLARLERLFKLGLRAGMRERRGVRNLERKIAALTDAQIKTEEIQRQNSEDIAALITTTERVVATTERNSEDVKALTETVRLFVERQNGDGKA